jgi:hypothetical protein
MDEGAALRLALDLLQEPWGVRLVRQRALPDGVPLLLKIAAGDPDSEATAADAMGRPREAVRHAASFFIEQILLAPETDHYRVLGAGPPATTAELRQNMALLMRWLHPDVARAGDQSVFATRIAAAWNTLKSPERRAAYDGERQRVGAAAGLSGHVGSQAGGGPVRAPARHGSAGGGPQYRRSRRSAAAGGRRAGGLPRVLAFLLGKPRR